MKRIFFAVLLAAAFLAPQARASPALSIDLPHETLSQWYLIGGIDVLRVATGL
jgi:hypothetical protein